MSQLVWLDYRCEVSLPDGSVVNTRTKEGANAFLMGGASGYFSSTVNKIKELEKRRSLDPTETMQLYKHYYSIDSIALYADRELFRAKVPQSEIEELLKYFVEKMACLQRETKSVSASCSDFMFVRDKASFDCCINMFFHEVPVELAIKSDFFSSLADFVKAQSGNGRTLPNKEICLASTQIVSVSILTLIENGWSIIEVFEKLEPSGILVQFLRCSTIIDPEKDLAWHRLVTLSRRFYHAQIL